jgi:hypothetical protein
MIRSNGNKLQINIKIDQADEEEDELAANEICGSNIGNCIVFTWGFDGDLRVNA